jgi:RNA polymerase sigma-70 factor, ECF subfamily
LTGGKGSASISRDTPGPGHYMTDNAKALPAFPFYARRNLSTLRALMKTSTLVRPEEDEDVQLMLSVQRGDRAAFRQLFEKHIAGVVGFATQFVGARARAEELAQDAFLQVYRARHRYVPRARFKTWLYRIVANACLSDLRRSDTHGQHASARVSDGLERESVERRAGPESTERSTEEAVLGRELIERVQQGLAQLPSTQRAALVLARGEGLSYAEVARAMSCSVSAVKSLVHRATVALRDYLEKDEA